MYAYVCLWEHRLYVAMVPKWSTSGITIIRVRRWGTGSYICTLTLRMMKTLERKCCEPLPQMEATTTRCL